MEICIQYWSEWVNHKDLCFRTYGLEDWTFAPSGLIKRRQCSGTDWEIRHKDRWFPADQPVEDVAVERQY